MIKISMLFPKKVLLEFYNKNLDDVRLKIQLEFYKENN